MANNIMTIKDMSKPFHFTLKGSFGDNGDDVQAQISLLGYGPESWQEGVLIREKVAFEGHSIPGSTIEGDGKVSVDPAKYQLKPGKYAILSAVALGIAAKQPLAATPSGQPLAEFVLGEDVHGIAGGYTFYIRPLTISVDQDSSH